MNFFIVYIIEPHPYRQICPYTGNYWLNYPANFDIDQKQPQPLLQPNNFKARIDQAIKMKHDLIGSDIPVLVDRMDNPVWCTYGPAPNNAYFIGTDGVVIEKLGWYNRPEGNWIKMDTAIRAYLGLPPREPGEMD